MAKAWWLRVVLVGVLAAGAGSALMGGEGGAAPAGGPPRLKEELAKIDAAKEKDDFFKLGAAALLWRLGGPSEAPVVARLWTAGGDLTLSPHYVFYAALDAARTQDM